MNSQILPLESKLGIVIHESELLTGDSNAYNVKFGKPLISMSQQVGIFMRILQVEFESLWHGGARS